MLMLEYCMPRFSLRLRIVVSIAFLVAVAPVAAQWFVGLANGSAIFGGGEAPAALTALLAALPRSTSAIVFIGGIVIGAWTDWLFRTFEDKRRNAGKGLGAQLTRLGDELARLEFSGARTLDWPKNLGTARLGVARALVRMGKFGIWNPGAAAFQIPRGGEFLVDFFREIGTLLQSERFEEAKARARAARLRFELIGHLP
jgi:hypothetical protein